MREPAVPCGSGARLPIPYAVLAAMLASLTIVGCGGGAKLPPPIASKEEFIAKKKAFIVFGAQLSTAFAMYECARRTQVALVHIQKSGVSDIVIDSIAVEGVPGDTGIYYAELDPGLYGLTQVTCRDGNNLATFTSEREPFAHFEIAAGDVVDAGTVHINMFGTRDSILTPAVVKPLVVVQVQPSHNRKYVVPEAIRDQLKVTPMRTQFPATANNLTKACEEQRAYRKTPAGVAASALKLLSGIVDAPICTFTGKS